MTGNGAGPDLPHSPPGVLAYQRFNVIACAFQCRQDRGVADIAEHDTDVAEKTAAFDAKNRRAPKAVAKLLFVPRQEFGQGRHLATLKLARGREFRKSVPRTGFEAVVAPEDVVANEGTQLDGNLAF